MSVRIQSRGLNRLRKKLGAIPEKVEEAAAEHVETAAHRIRGDARSSAPVLTGQLRDSIAAEFADDGLRARVGSNLVYAPIIEFGRRGKPYLFPATEAERPRFQSRIRYLVKKALKDVAAGGGV